MSKVIRVIVLCPNGRRETLSLTSNSSILQILEEACRKQKLNPDEFDICHYNKPLDLTLPVRFANLPNNAQLELQPAKNVRKDCLVTIGLQLESGERIMKDFVPSSSIWDIVEHCLSTRTEANIDKKGEPVCIYMRQKLVGDDLKNTTLRNLGLTKGSAIIRLMYRNPEDLSDQAHVCVPLPKPSKEISIKIPDSIPPNNDTSVECDSCVDKTDITLIVEKNVHKSETVNITPERPVVENVVKIDARKNVENLTKKEETFTNWIPGTGRSLLEDKTTSDSTIINNSTDDNGQIDQKMELGNNQIAEENSVAVEEMGFIHYIGGRHAVLYSLDDITPVKKADLPDDFFELTVADVRYLMQEYKKARVEIENKPLMTKELRSRRILQKLGRFKQTVIRVYFPERLVLQAVFEAEETVQDVCDFIKNYLVDQSLNFYLYTAPPKEKKDPTKSLIESTLIPAAVMYFGSDKQCSSYLMRSLKEKISDPRAASRAAYESRKQAISMELEEEQEEPETVPSSSVEPAVEKDKVPGPSVQVSPNSIQSTAKVPKWLKLGKK